MEKHVLLALMLVPMAFAQGTFFEIKEDGLDAALDNAVCKQEYMTGAMESVMEAVNGTDLQDDIDALEGDITKLESLAEADDFRGFVSYVRSAFTPHLLEARKAVGQIYSNLPAPQKLAILGDLTELGKEYSSCNSESAERYANAKVAAYETALDRAEVQIQELSAKGVNTSGLSILVKDAKSEIMAPLKEALEEADSGTEIRKALSSYCLFDGCPSGKNFHFAAKFGHERLQQILYLLDDRAEADGLGDAIDEAQSELDDAKAILDSIGNGEYTAEEGRELWSSLDSAVSTLRRVLASLRSG